MTAERPDTTPATRKSYLSQLYALAVAAVILIAISFAGARFAAISSDVVLPTQVNGVWLLGAALMNLLFLLVTAFAWRRLVMMFTRVAVPFASAFSQVALVLVGKYLPGKIWGMALRGNDLMKRGITFHDMLKCNYTEQLVSLHAGAVLGLVVWLVINRPPFWVVGLVLLLASPLYVCLLNNVAGAALVGAIKKVWHKQGLALFHIPLGSYVLLFLVYLLEWLCIGGILACLWSAVSPGGPGGNDVVLLIGVNAIAMIAGFLAFFSPGGLGVREGVMVGLLAGQLGLSGALLLSVVFRGWLILSESLAGLVAVKLLSRQSGEPV